MMATNKNTKLPRSAFARRDSNRSKPCARRGRLYLRFHQAGRGCTRRRYHHFGRRSCRDTAAGLQKVQSMVFCGIYPAEGEKYESVKDALEKAQVNDAAFTFEPETSQALGYGFRRGFLGLCTWRLSSKRLEREFDLSVITTSPSVIYRVVRTDGTVEMSQNPSNLPSPQEIDHIEEPMVKANIMIPNDYVGKDHGAVPAPARHDAAHRNTSHRRAYSRTTICRSTRLSMTSSTRSNPRRAATARSNTNSIVTKNRELVKLDIMLNRELVDAFSMIVHESGSLCAVVLSAKSSRRSFRCTSSKYRFRRPSDRRSSPEKRSRLIARTLSPSATAAIFRVRESR